MAPVFPAAGRQALAPPLSGTTSQRYKIIVKRQGRKQVFSAGSLPLSPPRASPLRRHAGRRAGILGGVGGDGKNVPHSLSNGLLPSTKIFPCKNLEFLKKYPYICSDNKNIHEN